MATAARAAPRLNELRDNPGAKANVSNRCAAAHETA